VKVAYPTDSRGSWPVEAIAFRRRPGRRRRSRSQEPRPRQGRAVARDVLAEARGPRRLTSGVAHEVRTPSTRCASPRVAEERGSPTRSRRLAENLDVIAQEIQRLDRVVQGFLKFVRPRTFTSTCGCERLARGGWTAHGARGRRAPGRASRWMWRRSCRRCRDVELLQQACTNLVTNAIQALPNVEP